MTDLPNRLTATPAEIDAHLRTILAEDVYLRFQQAISDRAIAQTVEDVQAVRAAADNEGLHNTEWREGWDDVIDRIDPDRNDPYPVKLIDFPNPDDTAYVSHTLPPRDATCTRPGCGHTGADHHHGDTKCWAHLPKQLGDPVTICDCPGFQPA